MSKNAIYAIIFCYSLTMAYSTETVAQRKLLEEISIDLDVKGSSLIDLINEVEQVSDFTFMYSKRDLSKKVIDISNGTWNMSDLLHKVSEQTKVSIKRVNETIAISVDVNQEPHVSDLIENQRQVTGKVTDENGESLPGASVIEKGTANGTITDIDGSFSLDVSDDAVLNVSFVGYKSIELPVNGQSQLTIQLKIDISSLEEVVVVGYGTQEKKDLTGSVATVNSDVLANRQSVQVSDALQGTMAGVTVTRNSGQPGSGSTVRVRGVTSLNVNDPLVIVDGVPGLGLNEINPNDIESISVLKDAASQAIYGARAAAGVILVTTKRGKSGTAQVNYNYEFGLSNPTRMPKYVDAQTYRRLYNEASNNDGGGDIWNATENDNYVSLNANDPDLYPNTDWQKLMLDGAPTSRQRHDLSMSMGGNTLSTRASLSYVNEDGLYEGLNYERYTFRINNNLKFNEVLSANFDLYYHRSESVDPNQVEGGVITAARRYPAVYPGIRTDGDWGQGKDGTNPLAQLIDGGQTDRVLNRYNGVLGFILEPLEGLQMRVNFSPTFSENTAEVFTTPPLILRQGSNSEYWPQNITNLAKVSTSVVNISRQATIGYQKEFDQNNLNVLVGYEEIGTDYESFSTTSRQLSVNLPALGFGDPSLVQNSQVAHQNALRSYFGRLTYSYNGKYLVQSNLRYDGSSRFSEDQRWGLFPSASLGWIVSNESFSLPKLISFLKARTSYGVVGNERIGDSDDLFNYYPYLGLFERTTAISYNGTYVPALGINQSFLADRGIQWETTKTLDFGIDLGLFDDKLTLAIDYYQKQTDDIILTLDLPNYIGFTNDTKTNVGSLEAKGLDVELSYRNQIGDLKYQVGFNISNVSTKVIDVGARDNFITSGGIFNNIKGSAYNEWFGYQSNGLYVTQEEADDYGAGGIAGDIWITDQLTVDTNNDGIADARDNIINEEDKVILGPSLPEVIYGGNISLEFKGFDFSFIFNGIGKQNLRYEGFQVRPFDQTFGNVPQVLVDKSWRPGNTAAENQAAEYPRFSLGSTVRNYSVSDFWMYNASYFRVKNITLGYSMPNSIVENLKLQQLRVYVGLRDYFTIDNNFIEGWDPEVDGSTYPIMKSVLFGLNVKF